MLVLTIDTATSYVVSGLVEVNRRAGSWGTFEYSATTLSQRVQRNPRGHMELLVPHIQESLAEAGLRPRDVEAVVVGTGPGPFTGLRVGMATGAAFADAIGVPVFGVDSLSATAASVAAGHQECLVLSDARRREWYSATATEAGRLIAGPAVGKPADVLAEHGSKPIAVALTAEVARAIEKLEGDEKAATEAWRIITEDAYPTPEGLALAGADQLWWLEGEGHFVERLRRPLVAQYLRRPDAAEPKRKERTAAVNFAAAAEDVAAFDRLEAEQREAEATLEGAQAEPAGGAAQPANAEPANAEPANAEPTAELLTLDSASLADLAAMARIEQELFSEESPWSLEAFRAELANPRNYYVALRVAGQLQGYAGIALNGPTADPEWEIHTVALSPEQQGKGYSRLLMDKLFEPLQVIGGPVYLEVRDGNAPAVGLYESYGFEVTGRRKGYYQPSGADALTMFRPDEKRPSQAEEGAQDTGARDAAAQDVFAPGSATDAAESMLVMGIESSCDETGVGVVRMSAPAAEQEETGSAPVVEELVNQVASSMEQHARFGGVVPEIASRAHLEAMQPTMRAAMRSLQKQTRIGQRPDAVAVTIGPGLAGALMVGAAAAKAYAAAWEVPFYAVNHLGGHVAVEALTEEGREPLKNAIALLVSGGHTQILQVDGVGKPMTELGSTLDDAAGEAYDKVSRLLGLGYPGGPVIDRLARQGNRKAIAFPRGMMRPQDSRYDFSFSGLKTSVARFVERAEAAGQVGENAIPVEDVCASFQEAVADVLTAKALRACEDTGAKVLLLGGGVSANSRLRGLAADRCRDAGVELRIPPLPLCTDNGVMIAALAAQLISEGAQPTAMSVGTDPALEVEVPILTD
ncbi:tRNA (adenosine(37)-N6)-threonylcarbamoyltransferase complex transferase subunit TsaD [Corynebacterium sp. UMB9976]|uniref:tRNA (adenosine(37)-N6)-threonylcarbamoyltransferase complex transferase subunit TsaD n=1 Tax=Corynebacterium sp. UMB9976 TaxID=3046354 RepID=UPI00254A16BF|nr:tRNA (adenosine(37)-N6)-threonylcarbamoyltransferase complex transferase subunit TsaD [Corynebacterium sp. UMB9976]MDK6301630.1 tRNA (adenosine(37)-N6)-threonylcarbamoyltransferase complex transferase subunit TsaD [Corynebacterium sp. UMB9976]